VTAKTPILGDDGYLKRLLAASEQGLITEAERLEIAAVHEHIVRVRNEARILADCQALVDAGEARWIDEDADTEKEAA
jgi:hypothetical protein